MELLLFRPAQFAQEYNCSRMRVDDIPLEKRLDFANGSILMGLFFVTEILYIPCVCSIWKRMDNSCHKLLFYIAVTDMLVLWVCGFFTAYFALTGAVFCSHPRLIYILGNFGMGLWAAESIAELTLAVDRCLEMSFPDLAEKLFSGSRTLVWLLLATVYALYWLFFTRPITFSSIFCAWFFNPFVGYIEDTQSIYHNYLHSVHDTFMAFAFPVVYLLLGLRLMWATGHNVVEAGQRSVSQKTMFLQVALISGFNCFACLLYVAMQYMHISRAVILMAHYGWFFIHAVPPYIYLTINRTIRNDCRKMFASLLFRMAVNVNAQSSAAMPSLGVVHPTMSANTPAGKNGGHQQMGNRR